MKIAHLAFSVSDMKKSLDFYCNGLGFTHAFSLKNDRGEPWIEYLKVCDGQFIELFYPGTNYSSQNGSYMHLCLQVDDCVKTSEELEKKGIDVWQKPKQGADRNYQCWISDPDGHPVEIMQIDPSSPQANC